MSFHRANERPWPNLDNAYELARVADDEGEIIVYEHKNFRTLVFGEGIFEQSRICMGDPSFLDYEYLNAMIVPLLTKKPKHVTFLGLGGGALPSYLYSTLPDVRLSVVELRREVIEVAYEYFDLPKDDRLEVIHQEAGAYVASVAKNSTNLIVSDLFLATCMDKVQLAQQFYENCYQALSRDGWLTLNFHKKPAASDPSTRYLLEYFPSAFVVALNSGNWIVMASKKEIGKTDITKAAQIHDLPSALTSRLRGLAKRMQKIGAAGK